MKCIYLFSALVLALTIGCSAPSESENRVAETTQVEVVEAPETDAVVEEDSITSEAEASEDDSLDTEAEPINE